MQKIGAEAEEKAAPLEQAAAEAEQALRATESQVASAQTALDGAQQRLEAAEASLGEVLAEQDSSDVPDVALDQRVAMARGEEQAARPAEAQARDALGEAQHAQQAAQELTEVKEAAAHVARAELSKAKADLEREKAAAAAPMTEAQEAALRRQQASNGALHKGSVFMVDEMEGHQLSSKQKLISGVHTVIEKVDELRHAMEHVLLVSQAFPRFKAETIDRVAARQPHRSPVTLFWAALRRGRWARCAVPCGLC